MQSFSLDKATEILENEGREAQLAYCMQYADGDQKDPDALACLGQFYHNAEEPDRNLEKAEKFYREAALGGSKIGKDWLFELGCQYMYVTVSDDGKSIALEEEIKFPLDLKKAENILTLCDQFEDARLSYFIPQLFVWLGNYYRYGWNDIEKDSNKAQELFKLVADSEDKEIQLQYANYMADTGNDAEAYKYYYHLSENQKYVPAIIRLSEFVADTRDFWAQLSFKCLRKTPLPLLLGFFLILMGSINNAAVAGILAVQLPAWVNDVSRILLLVGESVFAGTYLYVMISIYRSATKEIQKKVLLAELYLLATFLIMWFLPEVLVKAGVDSHHSESISFILTIIVVIIAYVLLYIKGQKRSFAWIQKASDTGDVRGIYELAVRYYLGIGVKKDEDKGVSLYKLAAQKGSNKAKVELGHAYRFGRGVEKDWERSYSLYLEAANAGSANAQYMVGYCLEHGIGVPVDIEMKQAQSWYQKGKENGSTLAANRLNKPLKPSIQDNIKRRTPSYSEAKMENEKLRIELRFTQKERDDAKQALADEKENNKRLTEKIEKKIDAGFTQVTTALNDLSKQLETANQELKNAVKENSEALLDKFSEYCKIAQAATIEKATASEDYRKQAEHVLEGKFGDTWRKLDKESQISLISARTLLAMLKGNQPKGAFDYSGIAICASSALENELIKHFFNEFIRVLRKEGIPEYKWPKKLIEKKKDFTLGDFRYLIDNSKEESDGIESRNKCLQEILVSNHFHSDQPNRDLIRPLSGQSKSFVKQCDYIRSEYRNPSAHAETVDEAKALSCCKWIMGRYDAEEKLNSTESVLILLFELLK